MESHKRQPGETQYFDPKPFLDAANQLVMHDEIERAVHLLENLPGRYRDFVPKEVVDLRNQIIKDLMNAPDYIDNPYDDMVSFDRGKASVNTTLRGTVILQDVRKMNDEGKVPHIVDMGPGEYWLPLGLKAHAVAFTYYAFSMQPRVEAKAKELLGDIFRDVGYGGDQPKLFVANEIIEHLWDEREIYQNFLKCGGDADLVYVSTPMYTFGPGAPNWRNTQLGHLRTYTPKEFSTIVTDMFRNYQFTFMNAPMQINENGDQSDIMLLKGVRT